MDGYAGVLNSNVLVLNRYYQALRVVDARRAFSLLFRRLAEVVAVENDTYNTYDFESWTEISELRRRFEPDGHDWVHTVRLRLGLDKYSSWKQFLDHAYWSVELH